MDQLILKNYPGDFCFRRYQLSIEDSMALAESANLDGEFSDSALGLLESFIRRRLIDWSEYFEDEPRFHEGHDLVLVHVRFNPEYAAYEVLVRSSYYSEMADGAIVLPGGVLRLINCGHVSFREFRKAHFEPA